MKNPMGDCQHRIASCMSSLVDFFAHAIDTYDTDNNKAEELVYPDFENAFDKASH